MCDHQGIDRNAPARASGLSRRSLLRNAGGLTLAIGVGGGFCRAAHAADTTLKSTHGGGFCNLNLFLAHAEQLAADDGLNLQFVNTPTFADQVTFLGTGQVDVGLTPYTSFLALYDAGAPIRIVAGGGIEGCAVVAQPGIDSPESMKGKVLGTQQMDTLEVLPYDYLKKRGVSFANITVRYVGGQAEGVEMFRAGALDMYATIEPYASAALADVPGATLLTDGIDLYGPGYTDCVLAASTDVIENNPEALKALIKGMMEAQAMAESNPQEVLDKVVGTYYKTSMDAAQAAMSKQPAVVDARDQTEFILERVASVAEMGYIKEKPGREAIDWSLLEEVIAENPDLYASLKRKSAA
ncbi:ABC transporter substrate-binding protein [Acuticoccus sp. MNP-M23]|uniref:ABC transporter substrate-binding protein n=1 Tax=Acuticoccus sp. MNP-M23 TaxID=3072793 RepID=UPI002814FF9B|nr:ABC transporter substrate-binding protein [Acuticoccus sp. MNP-M23]WMS44527.1 ABC transporter substrate-binding protein [Acuticoccus sp. MNP-M23]